ncbi:MAG TPA: ATP-dependent Clp protease adaptor ClpS [Bacteroidia bacterium]|nr:ATP-dependent Clp protease adaptor ClpS [Bacteroidetes bacterium CHB6]HNR48491.1 ATP-dependent Clp protease adaptor ClpS [Bacteroidia bacterium]HNT81667.1 ATP-dependent Clp protease adaptor ClpS [Bacteroidia bacterium]
MAAKHAEQELEKSSDVSKERHLVLYNDDVNTFDFVIESLIEICHHERVQAEQCSVIVHNNGRCSVKDGTVKDLRPMCKALVQRGLTAEVE